MYLVDITETFSNPSCEEGRELYSLSTYDVASDNVYKTVNEIGQSHYNDFFQQRFIERTKKLTDPIKRNNSFSTPIAKEKSPLQLEV